LRGADVSRGRRGAGSAARNRQDASPLRAGEAAPGARGEGEGPMSASHEAVHTERISLYALHAVPPDEAPAVEAQIAACAACRKELAVLQRVVAPFVAWPVDVLRPPEPLWDRLAQRVATETGEAPISPPRGPADAPWDDVARGISVKLLATDAEHDR